MSGSLSMAASAVAVGVLTQSAKAGSSLILLIFAARHCALVDGGSSERNIFRGIYFRKYSPPRGGK